MAGLVGVTVWESYVCENGEVGEDWDEEVEGGGGGGLERQKGICYWILFIQVWREGGKQMLEGYLFLFYFFFLGVSLFSCCL